MTPDQILENKPEYTSRPAKENMSRSALKAITWRIFGTMDTLLISFLITGKFLIALSIGAVELITKTLLYFMHERIWNRINWGKNGKTSNFHD
ncbi:MAG: DUF2061 domain-containing protein [Saprospiraceae bacterium]|nr:DUF2061 domain-containing protein [Lewinellaceae bacterium]